MSFNGECKACQFCYQQLEDTVVLPGPMKARAIASVFRVKEELVKHQSGNPKDKRVLVSRTQYNHLDTPHVDEDWVPEIHEDPIKEEYVFEETPLSYEATIEDMKRKMIYWVNGTYQGAKEDEADVMKELEEMRKYPSKKVDGKDHGPQEEVVAEEEPKIEEIIEHAMDVDKV